MITGFVGLGPGKAGTSLLYHGLRQHSQISMSNIKERYFFTENWSKGIRWYENNFSNNGLLKGEISNRYVFELVKVVERAFLINPHTKFLIFIRDPVERAVSAFLFEKQLGYKGDLNSFINERDLSEFDNRKLLELCRQHIPNKQLYIVSFSNIVKDELTELNNICKYLGVDEFQSLPTIDRNTTKKARSELFSRFGKYIAVKVRYFGYTRFLQYLKNSDLVNNLFFYDQVDNAFKNEIKSEFKKHIPANYYCGLE